MELIPILSLIILVATISTFILAVGAYILYKVRERKGITAQAPEPAAIPAELVTPAPLIAEQMMTPERRTFEAQTYQREPTREPMRGPELKPTFVGKAPTYEDSRFQKPTTEPGRATGKKKFVRYTNEGYVEPERQDKRQEDNLRWR